MNFILRTASFVVLFAFFCTCLCQAKPGRPKKIIPLPQAAMSIAEFLAAGEGDPVDLDPVIITAVFPEVIYAQAPARLPAIAILGAAGVVEGNSIRLQGTKTTFVGIPAVNASPTSPPVDGHVELAPFGICNLPGISTGSPLMLGSLIKACGQVEVIGAGWFTVRSAEGTALVFGDLGTPPRPEAQVTVVGICSPSSGQNGSTHGIRVRRPTDVAVILEPVYESGITIEDAFCRGGQVFVHWSDPYTTYVGYRIYRSDALIDASSLGDAEAVGPDVPLHSTKDRTAAYIATAQGQPDPNVGLRIDDLGPTLSLDDGLEVTTVKTPGQRYYCVVGVHPDGTEDPTVILGRNSTSTPVDETLGPPCPVLDTHSIGNYGCACDVYNWFRRDDETLFDGQPTKVAVSSPMDYSRAFRAMLFLHHLHGVSTIVNWQDWVVVSPCDFTSGLPYYGNSWWYGYADHYPNLTTGSVVNYTEVMLTDMVEWAKNTFPIDPNRVFLNGGSMGGTGSISYGLRHPELFAGINAQVPQVNPALPGAGFPTHLSAIWGSKATNLPTDEGLGVWDRMNMVRYVTEHAEDLPYLKVQNGRNDVILPWLQNPDFYRALNASRHGFIAGWGPGGHNDSGLGLPAVYTGFNLFNAVGLDQSYVAVSNSSANNNPGNGDPLDGDISGQMGGGLTWSIVSDTTTGWIADLTNSLGQPFTADISARRLQSFRFPSGAALSFSLTDKGTGEVISSGAVAAERENFFVLPQLALPVNPSRLSVSMQ